MENIIEKQSIKIDRRLDLLRRMGIGRSQSYVLEAKRLLPPPVKISDRAVGWPSYEIDLLIEARIAGQGDDLIRQLVDEIVEARQCRRRYTAFAEACHNQPAQVVHGSSACGHSRQLPCAHGKQGDSEQKEVF